KSKLDSGSIKRWSRVGEDALVVGLVKRDDIVGAEFFLSINARALTYFAAAVGAAEDFNSAARRFLHVAGFHQKSIHIMLDDFGHAAGICADDGNFAGYGFESR